MYKCNFAKSMHAQEVHTCTQIHRYTSPFPTTSSYMAPGLPNRTLTEQQSTVLKVVMYYRKSCLYSIDQEEGPYCN